MTSFCAFFQLQVLHFVVHNSWLFIVIHTSSILFLYWGCENILSPLGGALDLKLFDKICQWMCNPYEYTEEYKSRT